MTQNRPRTLWRIVAANQSWFFQGLSININGLNRPHPTLYRAVLSRYHLVALQETRFTNEDHRRTNEHFIGSVDANATIFWSPTNTSGARGRNRVGFILSSHHPFGPILNITSQHCNTSIHDRYLHLATSLLSQRIWIHVVYAPVQLSERINLLKSLPTNFP